MASRRTAGLLLLLGAIVLGGSALRFYRLDAQSLWSDELATWRQSHQPTISAVIENGVRPTPYPPAYPVLIYFVEKNVGDSEIALRLPSAVAGVLSIIAMFLLAKQLYSVREGVIAAGLLAFSYQPIYYSQEARAYSLLLLFAILSAHFWFRMREQLEANGRLSAATASAYVACASVAQYLHHFGLLLVALQLAALAGLFALRPKALVRVAAVSAAVVATYLPWIRYLIEDFSEGHDYLPAPGLHSIGEFWRFLFFDTSGRLAWFVGVLFGIAALRWISNRRDPGTANLPAWIRSPTALVIAWLVVPFGLAYLRSLTSAPILNSRNLIISLPAAVLLFARSLTFVLTTRWLQISTASAIAAVLVYGPFVNGGYYRYPRKEQFREAAAAVAARGDATSDVRVIAYAWDPESFDYYLERTGASNRVDLLAGVAADIPRTEAFLDEQHPEHVWFLAGHRRPDRAYVEFLDRKLELVEHVPLYGAFARLYRRRE
jgi:mannosyltransferase